MSEQNLPANTLPERSLQPPWEVAMNMVLSHIDEVRWLLERWEPSYFGRPAATPTEFFAEWLPRYLRKEAWCNAMRMAYCAREWSGEPHYDPPRGSTDPLAEAFYRDCYKALSDLLTGYEEAVKRVQANREYLQRRYRGQFWDACRNLCVGLLLGEAISPRSRSFAGELAGCIPVAIAGLINEGRFNSLEEALHACDANLIRLYRWFIVELFEQFRLLPGRVNQHFVNRCASEEQSSEQVQAGMALHDAARQNITAVQEALRAFVARSGETLYALPSAEEFDKLHSRRMAADFARRMAAAVRARQSMAEP